METGGMQAESFFDKRGKDLYNTVRLLVENSLDSAESISEPPEICITIEEKSESNSEVDGDHDNETRKQRKRKLEKTENAPSGRQVKDREEVSCYRVRCKDNRKGMSRAQIEMLAADAGFTKLGSKQTHGQFDLKLLLRRSPTQSIHIVSSMMGEHQETHATLRLANGKLVAAYLREKKKDWHGAVIDVDIEGDWTTYKDKILQFVEEIAYITSQAQFSFQFKAKASDKELCKDIRGIHAQIQYPLQELTPAGRPYFISRLRLLDPEADFAISVVSGRQTVEGFEFIVEAAVILGVQEVGQGLNIYRFANRVPLLFEEDDDVVTKTVKNFDWAAYDITPDEKRCVLVSIVSTKIPFKPCKECIEDDEKIAAAVRLAIKKCCKKVRREREDEGWSDVVAGVETEMRMSKIYSMLASWEESTKESWSFDEKGLNLP